jgi:hypothetical protein
MIQILAVACCLALMANTSAASPIRYNTNTNNYADNVEVVATPEDYSSIAEMNLPSDQADRIRSAMAKFFVTPNASLRFGVQAPPFEARIRTRSAPSSQEYQELSHLLDSLESSHDNGQRSTRDGQQQQQQQAIGGGHKSLRNIQPVFMRLPSRFGKRSVLF